VAYSPDPGYLDFYLADGYSVGEGLLYFDSGNADQDQDVAVAAKTSPPRLTGSVGQSAAPYSPDPTDLDFDLTDGYSVGEGLLYFDSGSADQDQDVGVAAKTSPPRLIGSAVQIRTASVTARTSPPHLAGILSQIPATRVAAKTAGPTLVSSVRDVRRVSVSASTRPARGFTSVAYDPNLLSDVVALRETSWRDGSAVVASVVEEFRVAETAHGAAVVSFASAPLAAAGSVASWHQALSRSTISVSLFRPARPTPGSAQAFWTTSDRAAAGSGDAWRPGALTLALVAERWQRQLPHFATPTFTVGPLDFDLTLLSDYVLDPLHIDFPGGPYHRAPRIDRSGFISGSWRAAGRVSCSLSVDFNKAAFLPVSLFGSWRPAQLVLYVRRPPEPPGPWEPTWSARLCLGYPLTEGRLDLGVVGCAFVLATRLPRQRSYLVLHAISLVRLPDRLPIEHASLSLSLDADSWAWKWSGTLLGRAALDAVMASESGVPVVLEALIDAHVWHLLVEDWAEDRTHGTRRIAASGRGLSAWLSDPSELPQSGVLGEARTVQQAMAERLPFGGGWTLAFADGTPDWLLPAGAWSWQNATPIQAMHAAASEVGLVIVPAMAAKALTVQPRYPVLPWDFAAADPDLIVPDSAIMTLARRQSVPSQANAVYVHGTEVGGLLARVTRSGSAGDRAAPTVSHSWITHADGARLLGSRLLAAQHMQPEIRSLSIPLGGLFPLVNIGDLLAVELSGETGDIRGIVNGVSVSASSSAPAVRQTLTLGEETPNVWAKWKRLLPDDPLLVGEIADVYADGTVQVSPIGGGTIRVRGEGTEGDRVWVRGGRIEGAAPALAAVEIEV
jgi:hypothetical protein